MGRWGRLCNDVTREAEEGRDQNKVALQATDHVQISQAQNSKIHNVFKRGKEL